MFKLCVCVCKNKSIWLGKLLRIAIDKINWQSFSCYIRAASHKAQRTASPSPPPPSFPSTVSLALLKFSCPTQTVTFVQIACTMHVSVSGFRGFAGVAIVACFHCNSRTVCVCVCVRVCGCGRVSLFLCLCGVYVMHK